MFHDCKTFHGPTQTYRKLLWSPLKCVETFHAHPIVQKWGSLTFYDTDFAEFVFSCSNNEEDSSRFMMAEMWGPSLCNDG